MKLVQLIDSLLSTMESDSSLPHFMLDGQMAVVDDYLEIRPEKREQLKRLCEAGRISVGPWYALMDEFLVSGETIVRNLQMGSEKASEFGGAMSVGYLPDMFGHISQMPQILRLAGLNNAVVWRGVPAKVDKTSFLWRSPDGSAVRAEYLPRGYGNGAALPRDPEAALSHVKGYIDQAGDTLGDEILVMNGTDHQMPKPWIGELVASVNEMQSDLKFRLSSLEEYLESVGTNSELVVDGELRSSAMANLLMGVSSNRVDVKQAAAIAERSIERMAEPLCSIFLPKDCWPSNYLSIAWRLMIQNSAHDSVCACSADEVVETVLDRYRQATQIAEGLVDMAIAELTSTMDLPGAYIINTSQRPMSGTVELDIPAMGPFPHAQVLSETAGGINNASISSTLVESMLREVRSQQFDERSYVNSVEIETDPTLTVTLSVSGNLENEIPLESIKSRLFALLAGKGDEPVNIVVKRAPQSRILTRVHDVDGYGWQRWNPETFLNPASVSGNSMTNGKLMIEVDPLTGDFSLNGVGGYGALVDEGDTGDTYNFCPLPGEDPISHPRAVKVRKILGGPVRGSIEIERQYSWPEKLDMATSRRIGERRTVVTTTLTLDAEEEFLSVHTRLFNLSRDHRLRTLFPLRVPATTSEAECAFHIVTRGLEAEGGPTEKGLATYPSRRFVSAGGLTVFHEGLLEYELCDITGDGAHTLALTLLRSVGILSRQYISSRPQSAGPSLPLAGPQLIKELNFKYAIALTPDNPYELADRIFAPLRAVTSLGNGDGIAPKRGPTITGAEVSSMQRHGEHLEIRVFNPLARASRVKIDGRTGWLVDLLGRQLSSFDESFELAPFAIATVRIND